MKGTYNTRKLALFAVLVSAGSAISILENMISQPAPWIKPGLANISTLMALIFWGFIPSFSISFLRVVVAAFATGKIMTMPFFLALAGSMFSAIIMGIVHKKFGFGIIITSILGSITHNLAQGFMAALILDNWRILYLQLPFILLFAIPTGFMVGILSLRLKNNPEIANIFSKSLI